MTFVGRLGTGASILGGLLGLCVAIAVGECGARILSRYAHPDGVPHWRYDPETHHLLKPGRYEMTCDPEPGRRDRWQFVLRIDAAGWRDYGPQSSRSERQILFLGDSFVQNNCIEDKDTFAFRTTAFLNAQEPLTWSFMNAGVDSLATCEEAILLERLAPTLQPTIAVLALYVGNDLQGNLAASRPPPGVRWSFLRSSHLLGWVGTLFRRRVPDDAETSPASQRLQEELARMGLQVPEHLAVRILRDWRQRRLIYDASDPRQSALQGALEVCLQRFRKALGQRIRGLVLLIPTREMVSPEYWTLYQSVLPDSGPLDPAAPSRLAGQAVAASGLPWCDATTALQRVRLPFFMADGHLRPAGIERLSELTAAAIDWHVLEPHRGDLSESVAGCHS